MNYVEFMKTLVEAVRDDLSARGFKLQGKDRFVLFSSDHLISVIAV
jgi:hypothetical protein